MAFIRATYMKRGHYEPESQVLYCPGDICILLEYCSSYIEILLQYRISVVISQSKVTTVSNQE